MDQSTDNLELLIKAIQSCWVTFKPWISETRELEWTSFSGADKKIDQTLHEDTQGSVVIIWRHFLNTVEELTNREAHTYNEEAVFESIHIFVMQFLELGKRKREEYQPKNITLSSARDVNTTYHTLWVAIDIYHNLQARA